MNKQTDSPIKLLITIVDRGKGAHAVDLYRSEHLHFDYLCMGLGTANSKILDYFGLSETEKDMVLTMVPAYKIPDLIDKANRRFKLTEPGNGILFTVPLSGVSSQVPQVLCKPEYLLDTEREVKKMESHIQYDLILTILNRGNIDRAMDAAREAGAKGGTVIQARRVGMDDGENLLGFTMQPEKEILVMLTPRSSKTDIMRAINKAVGLQTECRGILFSLPVEEMIGLQDGTPFGQGIE